MSTAVEIKDFYCVLGVARTASAAEIKWAYRKAAQRLHPDRNKAPDAAERFKDIKKAFDFLSDEPTRRAIDIILNHRASNVPRPEDVDRKTQRAAVMTTEGWLVKE
jgi:curved DNA-binding protein